MISRSDLDGNQMRRYCQTLQVCANRIDIDPSAPASTAVLIEAERSARFMSHPQDLRPSNLKLRASMKHALNG